MHRDEVVAGSQLVLPGSVPAPRWSLEGLHRLLRPGYGARANARDATRELFLARQSAWAQCGPALRSADRGAVRRWPTAPATEWRGHR